MGENEPEAPPKTGCTALPPRPSLRCMNRRVKDADPVVVIANREPYSHELSTSGGIVVDRPASGVVTGLEPMLRASGGTWIAYGGGSADWAVTDRAGRVAVPPEAPAYTLRRMRIDEDEYERYYSGFANEALWPLCHMAYSQPAFRAGDWKSYEAVNAAFARAAVEERGRDGLLLVQDYHFALVPRMVREQTPRVTTSLFWHIPWPNADVIGILPWKERVLDGMLGADIAGFHTREHCQHFLQSVQRYLPCRVDFDRMTVSYRGHETRVRAFPISVEWPYPAASRGDGAALRESLGIAAGAHVSIGVDRADYTKGLLERVAGVELLLEQNPSLIGRFVLVQIASPTRTRIPKYQKLLEDVRAAARRVNERFGNDGWMPVVLQVATVSPSEVRKYYAMANSAVVTPLHDGMNLVAKEYVASCEDGDGALVLSVFAGAAQELRESLLVNPYDAQAIADALLLAVRMPREEKRSRMFRMRRQIATHSIDDWSNALIGEMTAVADRRTPLPWRASVQAGEIMRSEVRP
jgi:trehalose 6-phosphate synthase